MSCGVTPKNVMIFWINNLYLYKYLTLKNVFKNVVQNNNTHITYSRCQENVTIYLIVTPHDIFIVIEVNIFIKI